MNNLCKKNKNLPPTVGIIGKSGKMGAALQRELKQNLFFQLREKKNTLFPSKCDLLIDFSSFSITEKVLLHAQEQKTPLVMGTTGLSAASFSLMEEVARKIPIFYSPNFSIGLFALHHMLQNLQFLFSCDITILETHHKEKKDTPSGSALFLQEVAQKISPFVSMHSIRARSVIGEHEVRMQGEEEKITLTHSVSSRQAFAKGALTAAAFLWKRPPALYSMRDLFL